MNANANQDLQDSSVRNVLPPSMDTQTAKLVNVMSKDLKHVTKKESVLATKM